ncbi:GTP cyclohydrolase II [Methylocucumis oryzae]|uniref:GTP cyclohydrolase II n=1 Tax=Methylocucumis oryzae TaxID=1632867 RepID=UPI000695E4F5|nr:GTP cyclohydrolase II [Methylocucumis oryzae]
MKAKLENVVKTPLPTKHGEFILHYYSNTLDHKEHIALVKGDVRDQEKVPVRIHSECFTGDVLGSLRCDCGEQLDMALNLINQKGLGVLIYLRQEGRGIGLLKKLQAYNLQDQGMDTVDANLHLGYQADEREYTIAALMLKDLNVKSISLITNNPEKIDGLTELGINVVERIPIEVKANPVNLGYLKTKANKMAHWLFQNPTKTD